MGLFHNGILTKASDLSNPMLPDFSVVDQLFGSFLGHFMPILGHIPN